MQSTRTGLANGEQELCSNTAASEEAAKQAKVQQVRAVHATNVNRSRRDSRTRSDADAQEPATPTPAATGRPSGTPASTLNQQAPEWVPGATWLGVRGNPRMGGGRAEVLRDLETTGLEEPRVLRGGFEPTGGAAPAPEAPARRLNVDAVEFVPQAVAASLIRAPRAANSTLFLHEDRDALERSAPAPPENMCVRQQQLLQKLRRTETERDNAQRHAADADRRIDLVRARCRSEVNGLRAALQNAERQLSLLRQSPNKQPNKQRRNGNRIKFLERSLRVMGNDGRRLAARCTHLLGRAEDAEAALEKLQDQTAPNANGTTNQAQQVTITCPVCMVAATDSSTLCGHLFCRRCIHKAIRFSHKCPTCRTWLNPNNPHRIYF